MMGINRTKDIFLEISKINIICSLIEYKKYDISCTRILEEKLFKIRDMIYSYECDNISSFDKGYCQFALASQNINNVIGKGQKIYEKLNTYIINSANKKIFKSQINRYSHSSELYNIEYGLSGTLLYLLHYEVDKNIDNVRAIVQCLIEFTKPIEVYGFIVPGWLSYNSEDGETVGTLNAGLYNGVSGLLVSLLSAYRKGIRLPEHIEAMERIVVFLIKNNFNNHFRQYSSFITFEEYISDINEEKNSDYSIRYGSLGIIISLAIWAKTMKRNDIRKICNKILKDIKFRNLGGNLDDLSKNNLYFEIEFTEKVLSKDPNNISSCFFDDYLEKLSISYIQERIILQEFDITIKNNSQNFNILTLI